MKSFWKYSLLVFTVIVLQGCFYRGNYVQFNTVSTESDTTIIGTYTESIPKPKDRWNSFGLTGGLNDGTESKFQIGTYLSWEQLSFGEIYGAASWYDMYKKLDGRYGDSTSSVMPFKLGVWIDIPVIKQIRSKQTVVYLTEDSGRDSLLYTELSLTNRRALGMRIGGGHFLSDFQSDAFAQSISSIYDSVSFQDKDQTGLMYVPQGSYALRAGLSFTNLFCSSLEAIVSDRKFKGAKYSKFSVYADVLIHLASQLDNFSFGFTHYDPGTAAYKETSFLFDPSENFKRHSLGIAFGISYRMYTAPRSGIVFGMNGEIGVSPGFYGFPGQAMFSEFGFIIGFGSIRPEK